MVDDVPAAAGQPGSPVRVQVVYAWPGGVWQRDVRLPAGACVADAVRASGFTTDFPQYPAQSLKKVGIFGRLCTDDYTVCTGDRIELLRPLHFDPQASRLRRARHRAQAEAARAKAQATCSPGE